MAAISPVSIANCAFHLATTYPVTSLLVAGSSVYVVRRLCSKEPLKTDSISLLQATSGLVITAAMFRFGRSLYNFSSQYFWTQPSLIGRTVIAIPALAGGLLGSGCCTVGLVGSFASTVFLFGMAIFCTTEPRFGEN